MVSRAFGEHIDYAAYAKEVNAIFPKPRTLVRSLFLSGKDAPSLRQLYVIQSRDANLYVYTDGQTTSA